MEPRAWLEAILYSKLVSRAKAEDLVVAVCLRNGQSKQQFFTEILVLFILPNTKKKASFKRIKEARQAPLSVYPSVQDFAPNHFF